MVTGFGPDGTWALKGMSAVQLRSPDSDLTSNTSFFFKQGRYPSLPQNDAMDPNPNPIVWGFLVGYSFLFGVQPVVFDAADGYVMALGVENGTLSDWNSDNFTQPTGTPKTMAYLGDGVTFLTEATASCGAHACPTLLPGQTVDLTLSATLDHTFGYPGQPPVDEGGLLNVDPTHPFDPPDSTANASKVAFSYVMPTGWTSTNLSEIRVSCTNRSGSPVSCSVSTPRVQILADDRTQYSWNWSNDPSQGMPVGDTWQAIIPLTLEASVDGMLPLDVCDLASCLAANDGPDGGGYTEISYAPYLVNSTEVVQSFPPAFVNVITIPQTNSAPPPVVPPPGQPILQPPTQVPVASPVPVPFPLAVPPAVQAAGAGFAAAALVSGLVMAGATRVALRPIPLGIRMKLRAYGRRPSAT
jgi:hypothetical protein